MKLICLNQDECGHIEKLEYMSDEEISNFSVPENLICSLCCSLALLYTDDHKPIFYSNDHDFLNESNALIALIHNLITTPKEGGSDA
jgi:hypothetical protein